MNDAIQDAKQDAKRDLKRDAKYDAKQDAIQDAKRDLKRDAKYDAKTDKNAELAEAADNVAANSATTPVKSNDSGWGSGWWEWLKPDDFFKAIDPSRPPITFQSILKFLVLINFVAGGFLAMYELNIKGAYSIDYQLVFISIFIGMYGYIIYKL